jgi:hypothetical protein
MSVIGLSVCSVHFDCITIQFCPTECPTSGTGVPFEVVLQTHCSQAKPELFRRRSEIEYNGQIGNLITDIRFDFHFLPLCFVHISVLCSLLSDSMSTRGAHDAAPHRMYVCKTTTGEGHVLCTSVHALPMRNALTLPKRVDNVLF